MVKSQSFISARNAPFNYGSTLFNSDNWWQRLIPFDTEDAAAFVFSYTLSDLISQLLVVVACIIAGWWLEQRLRRWARQAKIAILKLRDEIAAKNKTPTGIGTSPEATAANAKQSFDLLGRLVGIFATNITDTLAARSTTIPLTTYIVLSPLLDLFAPLPLLEGSLIDLTFVLLQAWLVVRIFVVFGLGWLSYTETPIEETIRTGESKKKRKNQRTITWLSISIYVLTVLSQLEVTAGAREWLGGLVLWRDDISSISLLTIVLAVAAVLLSLFIGRALNRYLHITIFSESNNLDDHQRGVLSTIASWTVIPACFLIGMAAAGVDLSFLTLTSGALLFGISFGMQRVVANIAAGILILMDRSIKIGHWLRLSDGELVEVRELRARYTLCRALGGIEYLIPNEQMLTNQVETWTLSDDLVILTLEVGISYNTRDLQGTLELCKQGLREILVIETAAKKAVEEAEKKMREAKKDEKVTDDGGPYCHIKAFGANSVDLVIYCWLLINETTIADVRTQAYLKIWEIFHDNNIEISFPQLDIHLSPAANPPPSILSSKS